MMPFLFQKFANYPPCPNIISPAMPVLRHDRTIFHAAFGKDLHIINLSCIFALLIQKDGGIRPCEVLATCAKQGATFYPAFAGTDK